MRCEDFAGAYGECMYLLVMAIRPEALPTDAAVLTEMVLALDAENEKLRVAMQTLKDMIFGKRSERFAVIVAEQLALELDDLATGVMPPAPANDDAPATKPPARPRQKARRNIGALPKHLPRCEQVIEPDTTACPCCAGRLHKIGEDVSEVLDVIPAILRVLRTIRPSAGSSRKERSRRSSPTSASRRFIWGMAMRREVVLSICSGRSVVVLSEYGITKVDRPIHINRALREAGFVAVREEDGSELLDPTVSTAFAVADHQIAHVYVFDPRMLPRVAEVLQGLPGIERVYDASGKPSLHLDHPRSGELVAIADARSWFTYYYWNDDRRAPDFARTVEIHRKPGYDPVELFLDPNISSPKLAIGKRLALRKLGFRALMDVIPLDATLVKGSHGRITDDSRDGPLVISDRTDLLDGRNLAATDVKSLLLDAVFT
jgi:hypothetical protein